MAMKFANHSDDHQLMDSWDRAQMPTSWWLRGIQTLEFFSFIVSAMYIEGDIGVKDIVVLSFFSSGKFSRAAWEFDIVLNSRQQEVPQQNLSQIYDIASIFIHFCALVRQL